MTLFILLITLAVMLSAGSTDLEKKTRHLKSLQDLPSTH